MTAPAQTQLISFNQPLANENGQGIIMVLVGSLCLLISLLALATSLSYVQTMNSTGERKSNSEDYLRAHLQAIKGTIQTQGGLTPFTRSLEPNTAVYNPVLTADLNNPTLFKNTFGFPASETISIHNHDYVSQFAASEFLFDANLNTQPFLLGTNQLRDLAYIRFTVDLTPADGTLANGIDGAASRHGEIYVAK